MLRWTFIKLNFYMYSLFFLRINSKIYFLLCVILSSESQSSDKYKIQQSNENELLIV